MAELTLGSLFDGLGGWQLAAFHNGVRPIWSSEIEALPMAITKKHFPDTLQLGDITKLDGATLPPVDIICAGSPCQDLSAAGKRKGLEGERSGLFRKAIDIVRGMRTATNGEYPKFFIWENVPGAFSSNKGADFQAVLEEISKAKIPMPAGGKWAAAGMVRSGRCDIAWRVLDAQYWGVPQRRKRIFLIADFRGEQSRNTAVLFERESVPGNTTPGGNEGQGTAAGVESNTRATSSFEPGVDTYNFTSTKDKACTMTAGYGASHIGTKVFDVRFTSEGTRNARRHVYKTDTSRTLDTTTTNPDSNHGGVAIIEKQQAYSFDSLSSNSMKSSNPQSGCRAVEVAKTLDTSNQSPAKNQGGIAIREVYSIAGNTIDRQIQNGGNGKGFLKDKSYTLNTIDRHAVLDINNHDESYPKLASGKEVAGTFMASYTKGAMCNQEAFSGSGLVIDKELKT